MHFRTVSVLLVNELSPSSADEEKRITMRHVAMMALAFSCIALSLSCTDAFQAAAPLPGLRAPGGTHHRLPFAACSREVLLRGRVVSNALLAFPADVMLCSRPFRPSAVAHGNPRTCPDRHQGRGVWRQRLRRQPRRQAARQFRRQGARCVCV